MPQFALGHITHCSHPGLKTATHADESSKHADL